MATWLGLCTSVLVAAVILAAPSLFAALGYEPALVQEIGWILHGAVSHLAIRRRLARAAAVVEVGGAGALGGDHGRTQRVLGRAARAEHRPHADPLAHLRGDRPVGEDGQAF
jgi:hypothetical protein